MSAAAAHRPGVDLRLEDLLEARRSGGRDSPVAPTPRLGGRLAGPRRGAGLDIRDLRPFMDGDDMRHVDAGATARFGRMHVRTFHEECDNEVLLVADFRSPMLWGTKRALRSVAAAKALAAMGWRVTSAGGRVGVLAVRDGAMEYAAPAPRDLGMLRVAGALVRAHQAALAAGVGECDGLDEVIERAARLAAPGTALILASGLDVPGRDLPRVLAATRRRVRLSLLRVRDALQIDPPTGVFHIVSDGKNAVWARFDASNDPAEELIRNARLDHADVSA